MKEAESARIPSLDGFRAVSILLVLASHVVFTRGFFLPVTQKTFYIDRLGMLGVRVFFVISGFLITGLLLKEIERSGKINLLRFYFRRSMRIFVPFYFFLLVVLGLWAARLVNFSPLNFLHAFTYTVNYYPQRAWEVGHAWSLSVEEQFYLLWATLMVLFGRKRGVWIALGFIAAAPLIRLGYDYLRPDLVKYEVGYRFETAADAIVTGCLLALLHDWLNQQRVYQRILSSRLLIVVPFIVLYAAEMDPTYKKYLLAGITLQNLGIALCVSWGVSHSKGVLGRLLNSRPLVFIGIMSYSIYLWQQLFLDPRSDWLLARYPWNLLAVAAAALFSYFVIERPSLELRQRLEKSWFSPKPETGSLAPAGIPVIAVSLAQPAAVGGGEADGQEHV